VYADSGRTPGAHSAGGTITLGGVSRSILEAHGQWTDEVRPSLYLTQIFTAGMLRCGAIFCLSRNGLLQVSPIAVAMTYRDETTTPNWALGILSAASGTKLSARYTRTYLAKTISSVTAGINCTLQHSSRCVREAESVGKSEDVIVACACMVNALRDYLIEIIRVGLIIESVCDM